MSNSSPDRLDRIEAALESLSQQVRATSQTVENLSHEVRATNQTVENLSHEVRATNQTVESCLMRLGLRVRMPIASAIQLMPWCSQFTFAVILWKLI
ncbi:MAG: hypothetical protein HC935_05420 [Pseudanabaena sp. SU_2_4]|nr:hypothetical protein [Pseudanabaena sp. SU_2_4]